MTGRWPTNVILSPAMSEVLDEQSGFSKGRTGAIGTGGAPAKNHIGFKANSLVTARYDDEGGASRFFLQAGYEPWELEWILANGLRPCGMEET